MPELPANRWLGGRSKARKGPSKASGPPEQDVGGAWADVGGACAEAGARCTRLWGSRFFLTTGLGAGPMGKQPGRSRPPPPQ